jgi:hypothetical protein
MPFLFTPQSLASVSQMLKKPINYKPPRSGSKWVIGKFPRISIGI